MANVAMAAKAAPGSLPNASIDTNNTATSKTKGTT